MKTNIVVFGLLLFIGFLFEFWRMNYSSFHLPDYISETPIKISGVILVSMIIAVLVLFQKKQLSHAPETNILTLTFMGVLMCLVAEIAFQEFKNLFFPIEGLFAFLKAMIQMLYLFGMFSFLVAFQLKTRKTGMMILLFFGFSMVIKLIKGFCLNCFS